MERQGRQKTERKPRCAGERQGYTSRVPKTLSPDQTRAASSFHKGIDFLNYLSLFINFPIA